MESNKQDIKYPIYKNGDQVYNGKLGKVEGELYSGYNKYPTGNCQLGSVLYASSLFNGKKIYFSKIEKLKQLNHLFRYSEKPSLLFDVKIHVRKKILNLFNGYELKEIVTLNRAYKSTNGSKMAILIITQKGLYNVLKREIKKVELKKNNGKKCKSTTP